MAYIQAGKSVPTHALPPIVTLAAKSATSSVPVALDGVVLRFNAAMQITAATGVTSGAVTLQGSLDGSNWYAIGSAVTLTAAGTQVASSTSVAFRYLRAAITTTIAGGGSPSVTVLVAAG